MPTETTNCDYCNDEIEHPVVRQMVPISINSDGNPVIKVWCGICNDPVPSYDHAALAKLIVNVNFQYPSLTLDASDFYVVRAHTPFIPKIQTPWKSKGKTRQQQGTQTEKRITKERGARLHPRSGAGLIADDSSDEATIYEIKDANKSHTLSGADLDALLRRAVAQGKSAEYVVFFRGYDLEATISLKRRVVLPS